MRIVSWLRRHRRITWGIVFAAINVPCGLLTYYMYTLVSPTLLTKILYFLLDGSSFFLAWVTADEIRDSC